MYDVLLIWIFNMTIESASYDKHKNLKLAANDLGIKWQTLYSRLKKQGVSVVGDKLRYGSDRDKLSALAECEFKRLVPSAKSMNDIKWQHKYDFSVNNHKIDVKCAMPKQGYHKYKSKRWAFSFKKQSLVCDFICCFCMSEDKNLDKILLVPSEFFKGLQTVSVSCNGNSKWLDYQIDSDDLSDFFESL